MSAFAHLLPNFAEQSHLAASGDLKQKLQASKSDAFIQSDVLSTITYIWFGGRSIALDSVALGESFHGSHASFT